MNDQFQDIIGLTIEAATPLVADRGITRIRATSVDGNIMMGTMDMQPTRLNVSTWDGVIESVGRTG